MSNCEMDYQKKKGKDMLDFNEHGMENNVNQINEWFDSVEYLTDIDEMRTEIMKSAKESNSESSTAAIFENKLYHLIKLRTGINIEFRKEVKLENAHSFSGISGNGRVDAIVNDLLIEYKHYSNLTNKLQNKKAINQVIDYLVAMKRERGISYNAILTDGISICYFSFLGEEVKHTALSVLTNDDIDMIIKAILANNTKKFVPENILRDFYVDGLNSSIARDVALVFYKALCYNITEKSNMLFKEWKNLMHLSVEDNGKGNDIEKRRKDLSLIFSDMIDDTEKEYYALYALQTTYAVIVKLIACKVIDKFENNTKNYYNLSLISSSEMQKFFEKMEDGYSYKNNNVMNFLEGDFFSWYADYLQWSADFWKAIVAIVKCIDQYSAFSFNIYYEPIDIFKDLYMSIIPKSIRHSMGEYFTPKWLADYVVNEAISTIGKSDWKAIDPCCGSGIFLVSLIKHIVGDRNIQKMSKNEKSNIKDAILSRVYGIDINPLSVLSARVGYYLALMPFGDLQNIEIPVYLGDSAILAENTHIDGIECYKYSVKNEKEEFEVVLPARFTRTPDFGKSMSDLQACVKVGDEDILYSVILENLTDYETASMELQKRIKSFSKSLVNLHNNHWDGIWIRIATNYMEIARLADFDIIVGNPPWVKWEHLPSAYASKIKDLCDIKHIFSGAGRFGGTQLNICALISNVTATNWLSKDGVLAFLMPDSIMSQNSYEGFRNFYLDYETGERLYLQKIDRWQAPLRPFRCDDKPVTQDFNTYYYSRKYVNYKKGIPVKNITRNRNVKDTHINMLDSFEQAKQYLDFSDSKAVQLSDKTTAFSYVSSMYDFSLIIGDTAYKYRTGVEFTPQELYMLTGAGNSDNKGHYRFHNKKFALSKYIIDDSPKNGWDLSTDLIYPIITGPHIEAFKYDSNDEYCILPYDKNCTDTPYDDMTMIKNYKDIYTYLADHKDIIESQSEKSKTMHRGKEFYALSKIGPYTFADYIVAARDNSKFCASVIQKQKTPWGEVKSTICVKHTIIISQRMDGGFITEDEAYYICGILNSEIVQQYIHSSFKTNGFSLNKSKICIPLFDNNNPKHVKISDIARKASLTENIDLKTVQNELMKLYIDICSEVK